RRRQQVNNRHIPCRCCHCRKRLSVGEIIRLSRLGDKLNVLPFANYGGLSNASRRHLHADVLSALLSLLYDLVSDFGKRLGDNLTVPENFAVSSCPVKPRQSIRNPISEPHLSV